MEIRNRVVRVAIRLPAGWSEVRMPVGEICFSLMQNVQTESRDQPASYSVHFFTN